MLRVESCVCAFLVFPLFLIKEGGVYIVKKEKMETKGFEEFWADCEINRTDKLDMAYAQTENCKAFCAMEKELYEKLKNVLPEEMHRTLMNFGDLQYDFRMVQRNYFYRHGFKDCAGLMKLMYSGGTDVKLDVKVL